MTLTNITVDTETRYKVIDDDDSYNSKSQDVLVIKIPIPGGMAQYEVSISSDLRKSIEKAVQLK